MKGKPIVFPKFATLIMLKYFVEMERLISIYSHISSWLGTLFLFASTFFGDVKSFVASIILACFLDLACGMIRSFRVEHKGVLSGRLVDFCWKSSIYILLFVGFVLVDKTLTLEGMWITRAYTAIIIFSEVLSMLANLAVSFPGIKTFSLVRKLIESEMAEKLKIDKEELKDALKDEKKRRVKKDK